MRVKGFRIFFYAKQCYWKEWVKKYSTFWTFLSVSLKNWLEQNKLENRKCCTWEKTFIPLSLAVGCNLPRGNARKERKCWSGSRRHKREQLLVSILGRSIAMPMVCFKGFLPFSLKHVVKSLFLNLIVHVLKYEQYKISPLNIRTHDVCICLQFGCHCQKNILSLIFCYRAFDLCCSTDGWGSHYKSTFHASNTDFKENGITC